MASAPIVLVPGFWLGAWAWDDVAAALRGDGHDVTALTLPGLESVDTDRSTVAMSDHVEAICDAVRAAPRCSRCTGQMPPATARRQGSE
jgi:pimeloyl-ACP methyl ester carboxylesterase